MATPAGTQPFDVDNTKPLMGPPQAAAAAQSSSSPAAAQGSSSAAAPPAAARQQQHSPTCCHRLIGAIFCILDFLIWIITLGPLWMICARCKRKSTTALGARAIVGRALTVSGVQSKVFRHPCSVEKLIDKPASSKQIDTVWDIFEYAYEAFKTNPALGTRKLKKVIPPNSGHEYAHAKFLTREFEATSWLTYEDVKQRATAFGKGLKAIGMESLKMEPDDDFDTKEGNFTMLLWEESCAEWFLAMQGGMSQSIVVSTAYATLGPDAVVHAVDQGHMTTILCNHKEVKGIMQQREKMPSLKNIIYTREPTAPKFELKDANELEKELNQGEENGVRVLSFDNVVDLGKSYECQDQRPAKQDVAILMYTSGSTGAPKGVVIKHSHIVAVIGGVLNQIQVQQGSYLGYLPLAHIFEMVMEIANFFLGSKIGYADPKSLTAGKGACVPPGALDEFKPTALCGVPKVWETIKEKADAKLKQSSPLAQSLFETAFAAKSAAMVQGRYTPLFDCLVFKKFRAVTGGKLNLAVSGGGAINESVQEWVRTCMGCPFVQGYGLTETCLGLTVQMPDDFRLGVAGSPLGCLEYLVATEMDITDSEKKPYRADDTKGVGGVACIGRGEVCVKGNNVSSGYYKMKEKTKEEFVQDGELQGFFRTGDIGMILPDGSLKIVDRKKNIVKLKGGEYVRLEIMNTVFGNSRFVDKENGGCCTFGKDTLDRPVILVQVKHDTIKEEAERLGNNFDIDKVCEDKKLREAVWDDFQKIFKDAKKANKLSAIEVPQFDCSITLLTKAWNEADGTLTSTKKIVPSTIQQVHKEEYDEMIKQVENAQKSKS